MTQFFLKLQARKSLLGSLFVSIFLLFFSFAKIGFTQEKKMSLTSDTPFVNILNKLEKKGISDSRTVAEVFEAFLQEDKNSSFNGLFVPSEIEPSVLSTHPENKKKIDDSLKEMDLFNCKDYELGVQILCNPDWELEEERDAILMIISSEPVVTVTVAKIDNSIKLIGQLNKEYLAATEQYLEGFQIESVHMAGREAVKVKAYSKEYPEIRLLDYYLVHNSSLYGLLFSVDPKENWDQYKHLIDKLVDSFFFSDPYLGET